MITDQRAAAAGGDLERFMGLDDAFHGAFAVAAGRGHAWMVIEAQKAQMDRVRYLSLPGATPIDRLIDQHEAILDAVARWMSRPAKPRCARTSPRCSQYSGP